MGKVRATVSIEERVLRAARVKAARTGRHTSEVVETALRRELGFDVIEKLWARADLSAGEAMALAIDAQHQARRTAPASADA